MAEPMPLPATRRHLDFAREMFDVKKALKHVSLFDEVNAFYSGIDEDESSTLCDICEALEFDDSSFGGSTHPCESTDGCQHPFFRDLGHYLFPDGHVFMSLPIQFERKDILPGLPSLTASAENGCQFCSLLISALQNRGLTKTPSIGSTVSITNAQYEWHTKGDNTVIEKAKHGDVLPHPRLHLFSLRVQVDSNLPFKLWFRISAPPSKLLWPCRIWYSDN